MASRFGASARVASKPKRSSQRVAAP
jgi:chorismate lyase